MRLTFTRHKVAFACLLATLVCTTLLCVSQAGAQNTGLEVSQQRAAVMIDGEPLFNVAGTSTYPAKRRAKEIAQRIKKLAQDKSFDPSTLEIRKEDNIVGFYADDEMVLAILPKDLEVEGILVERTDLVARKYHLMRIREAIRNYRAERTSENLTKNGLRALVRTAALVLLVFAVIWIFRKLDQLLEKRFKRRIEELEAKSQRILRAQQVWSALKVALRVTRTLLLLLLIYVFLNFVLSLFPWTRHIANILLGYIISPLKIIGEGFVDYLPSLFFLIVLFLLIRYLLRMTKAFFAGIETGRVKLPGFEAEWSWPTYRIVRILVIVMGLVIAYPHIPGSQSEAFKGISLLIGVLLSLGSSSLISNVMAGYTMTYRRAFKVGDRVKIGDYVGEIMEIRLLVTHMRSLKNEEIVIPNSTILNGEITNFSTMAADKGVILHTTVGIGYEVPWRQVEAMLLIAADRTAGVLKTPEPFVLQTSLTDFAVTYELNAYCSEAPKMAQTYTDLHRNIQDVFNENNVQIMTPNYEGDPESPKVVPKEHWFMPPATGPGGEN
jgi:small-conductance mechanosensitive channel